MSRDIPTGKWERSLTGGKTALKIGGKVLKYLSEKPFLPEEQKQSARESLDRESAEILFKGLSVLKGTALKIGQMLSLELDALPSEVRGELEKSFNQAPPINRALVRKVIFANLGKAPEQAFRSFDPVAFSAASLGQVHHAVALTGEPLAVKIQYPGIGDTIESDISMIKGIIKSMPSYHLVIPVLDEIRARLVEETDYEREAENTVYFRQHLKVGRVSVPRVFRETTTDHVLTLSFMDGLPVNEWLKQGPGQEERDKVAQTLYDVFIESLYGLNTIHADPNPGNFIVGPDLDIRLVDFGCVKRFDTGFADLYKRVVQAALKGSKKDHEEVLRAMNIGPGLDPESLAQMSGVTYEIGRWFARLYGHDRFDFGANHAFIQEGRQLMQKMFAFRKSIKEVNTNFVFLNRTRYGLIRLFQLMEARVRISNPYECE
jgi:predicted unusual protein kinase regulating ubiquinone biosynthesis (AarF/ABC1/UbiB family)